MIKQAKDLGKLIKKQRKKMKLTQMELAGLCCTGCRFIVELEAGKPTVQFDKAIYVANNVGLDLYVKERGAPDENSTGNM